MGEEAKPASAAPGGLVSTKSNPQQPTATRHDMFVEKLAGVPAIQALNLGPLFRSSQPVELTESETEYTVAVIKHVFPGTSCSNSIAPTPWLISSWRKSVL